MSLNDLSVAQLQQILVLIQQKERLQKELALIESTLFALESSYPQAVPSEPKTNKRNRRKSAPLKVAIVAALEGAGKAGLTADDIAKQTGCKKASIAVWLYTSGKKTKQVKKLGRGRFAIA